MSDYVSNLIQYTGLSGSLPANSDVFKQLNAEDTFCLPDAKPNVEQITKVIGELKISSQKIVMTPKGTSLEGQIVTGWKLVIEGSILLKIQYVADEPAQSVHAAHARIPFSTYIVLPENFIVGTPIILQAFIEDIYSQMVDPRCIFNNITILLTADFC